MRTTIEIDDDLLKEAMAVLGSTTKRAAVEAALHQVVDEMRLEKALQDMNGLGWEGDLAAIREGREPQ